MDLRAGTTAEIVEIVVGNRQELVRLAMSRYNLRIVKRFARVERGAIRGYNWQLAQR